MEAATATGCCGETDAALCSTLTLLLPVLTRLLPPRSSAVDDTTAVLS